MFRKRNFIKYRRVVFILHVSKFDFQESRVTVECIIPQKHHRTVMGAKGCKVQGIRSEFDVQIKFPDRDAQGMDHWYSITSYLCPLNVCFSSVIF
jgi:hypothetical protein